MLLLAGGLALAACNDAGSPSTDPPPADSPPPGGPSAGAPSADGMLIVATSTGGNAPDPDGYLLTVDGVASRALSPIDTAEIGLPAGQHTLRLLGVAEHCSLSPESPLDVAVSSGDTTSLAFEVICSATGVSITTTTTGQNIDPDGYRVEVDGTDRGIVPSNGTVLIRLEPGSRTIALTSLAPNCEVEGAGPRSVTVVDNEVAPIEFAVVCTAPPPPLPPSGVLAFTGPDGDIHLGDAKGAIARDLTNDGLDPVDTNAAWSPNGNRIAFTRGSLGIYLVDGDGTDLVGLSPPGGHDAQPSWSPDGRRIAFVHGSNTVADQIYIMNADGTHRVRLTTMRGGAFSPSWSPDGKRIAFSTDLDLYVIDVDGTNLSALTNDWEFDRDPAWSPDGRSIAFVRGADYGLGDMDSRLYLVNPDGTNLRQFANPWNPKDPAWTPDGLWITVTRKLAGRWELATIRVADGDYWARPFAGMAPSWGTP
jgi:dipeptidyl aminopeptidase/acylaminoacyl peptidase